MKEYNKGLIYVISAAIMWATSGVLGQMVYARGVVSPELVVTARFLVSGCIVVGLAHYNYLKALRQGKEGKHILGIFRSKSSIMQLCFMAIFGTGAVQLAYFYAIYESNAATATFLQYISPAIMILYMTVKFRRWPTKTQFLCTILAVCGVFFIATHGDIHNLVLSPAALFWGIVSAIALVIYTVYPVKTIKEHGLENVLGWSMIIAGILSLVIQKPWIGYAGMSLTEFILLGILILLGTVIAFTIYMKGVLIIGETKAAFIATLEPLSSALISFVFLNTQFVLMDYVGFACILTITFLTCYEKNSVPAS